MALITSWEAPAAAIAFLSGLANEIFAGFTPEEISRVTACLGTRHREFTAGVELAREGQPAQGVGLVLEGTVHSSRTDGDGSRHLLEIVGPGEVYGEDLLWETDRRTHRTVTAATDGRVLLIGMEQIVSPNGPLCHLRSRVVENLLRVMTEKNRKMASHLQIVSQKSLRSRLSHLLVQQSEAHGSPTFMLTLTRAQMAEHLNADRAALSRELSRMKAEGLIDYYRSSFRILTDLTEPPVR